MPSKDGNGQYIVEWNAYRYARYSDAVRDHLVGLARRRPLRAGHQARADRVAEHVRLDRTDACPEGIAFRPGLFEIDIRCLPGRARLGDLGVHSANAATRKRKFMAFVIR
ncbi:hypothetical protein [Shinella sp.]|uniref:hypothetical protein n=1 Tax=Shinella sp. TaxID=1870904 RepID=UPI0029A7E0EF|nr:hypothetical protein [Shinella sp.]MDX3973999.1 hypothetical protein [Shinella sp.]